MLPEKSIRLVIAPSPTSIEGEKASLAFRGLFLCVVHYLIGRCVGSSGKLPSQNTV